MRFSMPDRAPEGATLACRRTRQRARLSLSNGFRMKGARCRGRGRATARRAPIAFSTYLGMSAIHRTDDRAVPAPRGLVAYLADLLGMLTVPADQRRLGASSSRGRLRLPMTSHGAATRHEVCGRTAVR